MDIEIKDWLNNDGLLVIHDCLIDWLDICVMLLVGCEVIEKGRKKSDFINFYFIVIFLCFV